MPIVKENDYVIENVLPEVDEKGEFKKNAKGNRIENYHWFSAMDLVPGTGQMTPKGFVPPVAGAVWSPYFEDAVVFPDTSTGLEVAEKVLKNILGEASGAVLKRVKDSNYRFSWIAKK